MGVKLTQEEQDELELRGFTESHWFRVEARLRGDEYSSYSILQIERIPVFKHTPKGAWLGGDMRGKRFVLREMMHRGRAFAAPTLEQAKEDFRRRKAYHIRMLKGRLRRAEAELDLVDQGPFELIYRPRHSPNRRKKIAY